MLQICMRQIRQDNWLQKAKQDRIGNKIAKMFGGKFSHLEQKKPQFNLNNYHEISKLILTENLYKMNIFNSSNPLTETETKTGSQSAHQTHFSRQQNQQDKFMIKQTCESKNKLTLQTEGEFQSNQTIGFLNTLVIDHSKTVKADIDFSKKFIELVIKLEAQRQLL